MSEANDETNARRALWALTFLFAAIVSYLKWEQHASLQTQAYDLGVFTSALWNTAHGRFFYDSLSRVNHLGDHFSPLLLLLVPLVAAWKNAASLLIVQTLALAAALPAVYSIARKSGHAPRHAFGFALWLAVSPYLHYASRYDFHEVTLAVPLFLWTIYFWLARRMGPFFLLCLSLALMKEDLSLLLAFVGLFIAWESRGGAEKAWRRAGAALAVGAGLWFCFTILVVIPHFGRAWRPADFYYPALGRTPGEILRHGFNPVFVLREALGSLDKVKSLLLLMALAGGLPLASGGSAALLAAPVLYLLMSSRPVIYTFHAHYAAAVLPFLIFAMIRGAKNIFRWEQMLPAAVPRRAAPILFFFLIPLNAIFLPRYYHRIPADKRRIAQEIFRRIPAQDSVMTQNHLAPHLCFRREISLFPGTFPSDWALIDLDAYGWSLPEDVVAEVAAFVRNNRSLIVYSKGGFILFSRTRRELP